MTTTTIRTPTRRCSCSSSSSSWCMVVVVVVRKYGSIILLLTLYFGGQVLKKKALPQLGNNVLLLLVGDRQQYHHRGGGGGGILPLADNNYFGDNGSSSASGSATTPTAAGHHQPVVGKVYWCGNSPNSKALRYMFPEYEFFVSDQPWRKWSPPNTTLQEEGEEEEQDDDYSEDNYYHTDGDTTKNTTNILIMSMYQSSLGECDTRQALARFLTTNNNITARNPSSNSNNNSSSNNNSNNNKILFVNGESVGNVFDWSAIENGYVYIDDEEEEERLEELQQEEDHDEGCESNNTNVTTTTPHTQNKKKKRTKVMISNDVSQRVYQIGPVAGRSSGLMDDSTITTITTATTASTTTPTKSSSFSTFSQASSSKSSSSLTLRNSQQVFLFTIDLLSRMVHELEVEMESEQEQEKKRRRQEDPPILQHFDVERRLQTTETWKALTSPSHRRPRWNSSSGRRHHKYNAVAYFHNNCRPHRQKAARLISSVLPVHFGSEGCAVENPMFPNNTIRVVEIDNVDGDEEIEEDDESEDTKNITNRRSRSRRRRRDLRRDRWGSRNSQLFSKYKYCLVMENRLGVDGYMTEKLLNALLGGCLPIYAGLSRHHFYDIFNPHAVIYWDVKKPNRSLNLLMELESNSTKYKEMLRSPILRPHAVSKYFSITPSLGDGSLNNRIRQMMGITHHTIHL